MFDNSFEHISRLQNKKKFSRILNFTAEGLILLFFTSFASLLVLPYILPAMGFLLIIIFPLLIATTFLISSNNIKTAKRAYYTMSILIGFSISPEIFHLLNSTNGSFLLIASMFITYVLVKALSIYAKNRENANKPVPLRGAVLLYCSLLLFMLGLIAALMPFVPLVNFLYCGLGITLYSLLLVSDFMYALRYSYLELESESSEVLLSANIMLSIVNLFSFIIQMIDNSKGSSKFEPTNLFRPIIAALMILPVFLIIIYRCFKIDRAPANPQPSQSFTGSSGGNQLVGNHERCYIADEPQP